MPWSPSAVVLNQDSGTLLWFRDWIQQQTGIYYGDDKLDVLETRLQSACLRYGLSDIAHLANSLVHAPNQGWQQRITDIIVTNHTSFFREPDSYEYLRDQVVPHLVGRSTRMWSAACSTGEEAYSMAMVLVEQAQTTSVTSDCRVLGTDISEAVIRSAERAEYPQGLDTIPLRYRSYVDLDASYPSFRICQRARELCTFRRLNLAKSRWPFSHTFSVIFCRNVLYYFDSETQASLLRRMYEHTEDGGWLITSVTEPIRGLASPWRMEAPGIYRKDRRR